MKQISDDTVEYVKVLISKIVSAKMAAITEVENSDLYDASIDVDYVCTYIGAPVRSYVRKHFFDVPMDGRSWSVVRRLAASTVFKELLGGRRDALGFIRDEPSFETELASHATFVSFDTYFEQLNSGMSELVIKARTPIELSNVFFAKGDLSAILDTMSAIEKLRKVRFIEHAGDSLELGEKAMCSHCVQHSVFFEKMLQVFVFCKCAQLMKEESLLICEVYSKALRLIEEYAKSVVNCGYLQLSLAYTLSVIFNVTQAKCETLKKIMQDFAVLDHFMFGGILNCNDDDDTLHSKIKNSFFEVLSEEDISFLKLSVDDKLRLSYLG